MPCPKGRPQAEPLLAPAAGELILCWTSLGMRSGVNLSAALAIFARRVSAHPAGHPARAHVGVACFPFAAKPWQQT